METIFSRLALNVDLVKMNVIMPGENVAMCVRVYVCVFLRDLTYTYLLDVFDST